MLLRMNARRVILGSLLAGALLLSLGSLTSSTAAPRKDLEQVTGQVRDLQMQAAAASDVVDQAESRLSGIRSDLNSIQNRAERERADMRVAMSTIEDLARAAYTSGGMDPTLQLLMADDPSEFLAQAAVMSQLEEAQVSQLRRANTSRLRVAQTEAELSDREALAQQVREEMAAAQIDVDSRLAAAQEILAGLQEEERQRLAQLAEERRQQQLQPARAAASQAGTPSNSAGGSPDGGSSNEPTDSWRRVRRRLARPSGSAVRAGASR